MAAPVSVGVCASERQRETLQVSLAYLHEQVRYTEHFTEWDRQLATLCQQIMFKTSDSSDPRRLLLTELILTAL